MLRKPLVQVQPQVLLLIRIGYVCTVLAMIVVSIALVALLQAVQVAVTDITEPITTPFPIGVNPQVEIIEEQPDVDEFFKDYIVLGPRQPQRNNWVDRMFGVFAQSEVLQMLALSSSRVLVIYAGERHEEVADTFAGILRWNAVEKQTFIDTVQANVPELSEGTFLPSKYVVSSDATPESVAALVNNKFNRDIKRRYPDEIDAVVPFADALIVASLLEREAYDFTDMREISGVIWNRLFIDMALQLDATLQYAKGSSPYGPWWPVPVSADKWIDSPYNTYQNKGLPPTPIANPSVEAVLAALNPIQTDCLFYLHAARGAFYCSPTYEGHLQNINTYLR